jgi:hypothetical protein
MHKFLLQLSQYPGDQKDRLHCINLIIDFTSTPTEIDEMAPPPPV